MELPQDAESPSPVSILVIDADTDLCALMQAFFEERGFRLDAVHDGVRGLIAALDGGYGLVVLDVMLPGVDGFQLLGRVRRSSDVPVIMLTGRTAIEDRLLGFEAGADDYLPKPFELEELLARVRAVLRRAWRGQDPARETFTVNGVEFRPAARQAFVGGRSIGLTSIEYDILECLARSAGRVVSRDVLAAVLHQRDAAPFDRSVDVHVHHLRKKLGARRTVIRTVRGEGYLYCRPS
jgi:two-component system response regulator CpxR